MRESRITLAKIQLLLSHPFFGSILMNHPIMESDEDTINGMPATMWIDGLGRISFSSKWVESLSVEETAGVLAHEVCHRAYRHFLRVGTRHPQLWNIACDYAINKILIDAGFKLPEGGCYNEDYQNLTAEQIYDKLVQDVRDGKIKVVFVNGDKMGKKGKSVNECPWGNFEPFEGTDAEASKAENDIKRQVIQAAETAKSRGSMPSGFEGQIDNFRSSKVNWKERIRTFVGGNTPTDWSYRKMNRKYMIMSSVCMPTIENHGSGVIVIGIDQSGSVGEAETEQFYGEIKSLHEETRPEEMHVIYVDTQIHTVKSYGPNDSFEDRRRYACGGTQLRPAFDWVIEQGIIPDSFIFLTDLEVDLGEFRGLYIDFPVLWVTSSATEAPFGEVLKIEV